MKNIVAKALEEGMSYSDYRTLIDNLVIEGKTTGPVQSEALVNYTKLNATRMKRWERIYNPTIAFQRVAQRPRPAETWLVITEGWCGDAAHNLPFIAKMAETAKNISLRLVLRDENPELMDLFLTNGSRSIPKLIRLNENMEVVGEWGPRPATLQKKVMVYKANPTVPYATYSESVQNWYNQNKGAEIETEFVELLKEPSPTVADI